MANDTRGEERRLIQLDREDLALYADAGERDSRNGRMNSPTEWVVVTDQKTGDRIEIAPGPCGADCRCAMFWREVEQKET